MTAPGKGSDFYEQESFFHSYQARRYSQENANDTLERPVLMELLGQMKGARVLDLGCGDAAIGLEAMGQGCAQYTGLEGSSKMAALAREKLKNTSSRVIHASMEEWGFPEQSYELVLSRLALHYVEDIQSLFLKVFNTLVTGGKLVFSIEHPVITSTLQTHGQRTHWVVDQYFHSGRREQEWLGSKVVKYHRTIEEYFLALQTVGFKIEAIRESKPQRKYFLNEETYERRMRIPLFLFFSVTK